MMVITLLGPEECSLLKMRSVCCLLVLPPSSQSTTYTIYDILRYMYWYRVQYVVCIECESAMYMYMYILTSHKHSKYTVSHKHCKHHGQYIVSTLRADFPTRRILCVFLT